MPTGTEADVRTTDTDLFDEVREGLSHSPKRLPPKLFYDATGSRLFERITKLDAYYPTRTELGILERRLGAIAREAGPGARVVEFGTGDGRKLDMLLDALREPSECIPIDISREQLLAFARDLREARPTLEVHPLVLDYTRPFSLPPRGDAAGSALFFFPGSTLGNLEPEDAVRFLRGIRDAGGTGALLVLGIDLVKPAPVLQRAYDDEEGVTAAFNLNALLHLNRRFQADFDLSTFRHKAVWNQERSRVEMRLVCSTDCTVTLRANEGEMPTRIEIGADEEIVTEHSYKYRLQELPKFFAAGGWAPGTIWTDERGWFSVSLLVATEATS